MHIAEGFLPFPHALAWTVISAPFVAHGFSRVAVLRKTKQDSRLALGAASAFTFTLSALKLPSVTGSSSHPTGVGLGAILLGPPTMAAIGTVVLLFQAILLAHGGLTTLGANVFSMGITGPWVSWCIWKLLSRWNEASAAFIATALGDWATYVVTAFQLAIAFPDPEGGVVGPLMRFLGVYAITQVPLALLEGVLTVMVLRALRSERTALGAMG